MIAKLRHYILVWGGSSLPEAARKALADDAEAALCAGVTLSLADWRALAPVEQSAWLEASARVQAARAALVGAASASPRAACAVAAVADGGAALREHDRQAKTEALRYAANELRSRYGGE